MVAATPVMQSTETAIVQFLEQHRFSFPFAPTVSAVDSLGTLSTSSPTAVAGATVCGQAGPGGYIEFGSICNSQFLTWTTVKNELHETLHESITGGANGIDWTTIPNSWSVWNLNEAATESEVQDLMPGLLRAKFPSLYKSWLNGNQSTSIAYPDYVKDVRVWSAHQCGQSWRSSCAIGIRAKLFLTPPVDRLSFNVPLP